ncbi:4'-phosphopantetheinyl transferase family protein [Roseibium sediminicola]|uniref:4'-phosphopantetheinyl transferase superfamily protein n=1 Tax=Roseibium sediminicola TaxID=2933272 RepID=A0ABT0H2Y8_9HYPH|nr:4'-phosphopantetheinyl transferase superfamily protein [Roseibium sp. CAU 1639]MCK7616044.1 4'-phosphopantetheinyl transferase superfamily protein [Roseibium sp. CAU 1639]
MQNARVTVLETNCCSTTEIGTALNILSNEELERFQKFRFDRDRRDYALAHALLRRTLSELEPETCPVTWRFSSLRSGKPEVVDRPDLNFSLTHTRGLVACAVTRVGQIGIDAETDHRSVDVDLLMRDVSSPGELRALAALTGRDRNSRFLDFWTLKEAFLKACGLGISAELPAVGFSIFSDTNIEIEVSRDLFRADGTFRIWRKQGAWRVALAVLGDLDAKEIQAVRVANWNA